MPFLSAALFLSGASALACETVWMRMLARCFGVTVHAVAALVALYMGGLALGAALAPRLPGRRWARLYALLEAGAALASLAATAAMSRLPELVARLGQTAPLSPWARFLLAAPVLLPPTILLGATFPIVLRAAQGESPEAARKLTGRLYTANTLGAAAGTFLAGFWLIGVWGERATVVFAAALSLAAAAIVWRGNAQADRPRPAKGRAPPLFVLGLYALCGFCALGYEVLWSRQLIPVLGNSVYAFTLILAAYLLGLSLGSRFSPSRGQALVRFGQAQFGLTAAVLASLAGFRLLGSLTTSPDFLYSPISSALAFPVLAAWALLLVMPTAFALGLLFPLAARLCLEEGQSAESAVSRLYLVNTLGGIAGSLWAGFRGIEAVGVHGAFWILALINAALGAAALARARWKPERPAWAAAAAAALILLGAQVLRDPAPQFLQQRLIRAFGPGMAVLFHDESAAATVTGYRGPKEQGLLINGIDTAGTGAAGKLMAVIPYYLVAQPTSTLVICFGAGNTFRTASLLGGEVDAVDLVGSLFDRMATFFPDAEEHKRAAGRRLLTEDGRHLLLRQDRRYDIIIVDAAPPLFSAGAVNLYTREFFALADRRLTDQGLLAIWLPLPSFEEDYWRILSALTSVFPHTRTWHYPGTAGFLVLAGRQPLEWPQGELDRRLKQRPHPIAASVTEAKLRSRFLLGGEALRAKASLYPPLTDDRPVVEFPLPRFLARLPQVYDTGFLNP